MAKKTAAKELNWKAIESTVRTASKSLGRNLARKNLKATIALKNTSVGWTLTVRP